MFELLSVKQKQQALKLLAESQKTLMGSSDKLKISIVK